MDTIAPAWLWAFFVVAVLAALIVDLMVMRQQGAHKVSFPEALRWSMVWILPWPLSFQRRALVEGVSGQRRDGSRVANTKALEFLTGYVVEKSLAVDNIFIFLMIFNYFAVPPAFQKRGLMFGIIGAIVLRTVMILLGACLIAGVPLGALPVRRLPAVHRASRCC